MKTTAPKKNALKHRIDGTEVRNALTPLILNITPTDLKGKRKQPRHCVAAKCIRRMEAVRNVRVHLSRTFILFNKNRYWLRYITPASLKAEIIAFDRGGKFVLGSYILSPPKTYIHRVGGKSTVSGKERPKVFRHVTFGVRPHA